MGSLPLAASQAPWGLTTSTPYQRRLFLKCLFSEPCTPWALGPPWAGALGTLGRLMLPNGFTIRMPRERSTPTLLRTPYSNQVVAPLDQRYDPARGRGCPMGISHCHVLTRPGSCKCVLLGRVFFLKIFPRVCKLQSHS